MARLLAAAVTLALTVPVVAADPAIRLTAVIDKRLADDWQARGIKPAAPADDAEYLRRVYLDLVGRTPKVAEARAFLADADPAKRAKLVNVLLTTPGHAAHFAYTTRVEWVPQAATNIQVAFTGPQVERWLSDRYRENTPADEVVRRLITVKVVSGPRGILRTPTDDQADPDGRLLAGFYQANETKPELVGSAVSRLFLGVKLECAQCHDHPFAPLKRAQFWQFAAFFGEFSPLPPVAPSFVGPLTPQYTKNRLSVPNSETEAVATFFDGADPEWSKDRTPRQELARWLTDRSNPYFAKNLVNRTWARFYGVGLIDPVDEPGENNPPSHPQLLDELAEGFASAGFDNRVLIRAITASRAYQLTSRLSHPTQADPRRFARMNLKALAGRQIFASFRAATGNQETRVSPNSDFFDFGNRTPAGQFEGQFPTAAKTTEVQTSILQSLMLMNGSVVIGETSPDSGRSLGAVIDAPFLDTNGKLDALFLAVYCRLPTDDERVKYGSHIDRGGPTGDKKKATADVFWVLLNSPEFVFNH